jgi:hypothetical protein
MELSKYLWVMDEYPAMAVTGVHHVSRNTYQMHTDTDVAVSEGERLPHDIKIIQIVSKTNQIDWRSMLYVGNSG